LCVSLLIDNDRGVLVVENKRTKGVNAIVTAAAGPTDSPASQRFHALKQQVAAKEVNKEKKKKN
jgi:hypothetical protein